MAGKAQCRAIALLCVLVIVCAMSVGCGRKSAQGARPAPPAAVKQGRTIRVTPATLVTAMSAAGPGDTLIVPDGEYSAGQSQASMPVMQSTAPGGYAFVVKTRNSDFMTRASGTPGNPITIRAEGKNAVLKGSLDISGTKYVIVDGLRMAGGANQGLRAVDVDHVEVRNCSVYDTDGRWSVYFNNARDCVIENNEVYNAPQGHGISVFGNSRNDTVRGNRVHDCAMAGIYFEAYTNPGFYLKDILVENNVVTHVGNLGSAAITCGNISDSTFRNNLLYKNFAGGISFYDPGTATGVLDLRAQVVKFLRGPDRNARNTIVSNTVYFEPGEGRFCLKIIHKAPGFYIHNNVFYGGKYTTISVGPQALSGLSMDDNIVIAHKGYPLIGEHEPESLDVESTNMSIGDWQAKGYDLKTKFETDPLFVSIGKDDYRLSPQSPAIDFGKNLGSLCPVDIEGVKRPQGKGFDCGAYEYVPPAK